MPDILTIVVFLFFLSAASAVCAWWWWLRLPQKFAPPKLRSEASFGALVAGTISIALLFIPRFWPFETAAISSRDWIYAGWVIAGIAFVLSFFGRGKLRIAEMIMGLGMWPVWWELLQFDKYYM
jgi:hypothetical protein